MPTTIRYADILNYLTAIMTDQIGNSPHGEWWSGMTYGVFTATKPQTQVPNTGGVNIMDFGTPLDSPFYVILTKANGFQNNPQMPAGGPFITDAGYSATLPDGTTISGATIQANINSWLSNGFPE